MVYIKYLLVLTERKEYEMQIQEALIFSHVLKIAEK